MILTIFLTKPLQGSLFGKFRNMMLDIVEEDIETYYNEENYKQALIIFGLAGS